RERLLHELGTMLLENLHLDRIAVALLDETKRAYSVRCSLGTASTPQDVPETHALAVTLGARQGAVTRDELESDPGGVEENTAGTFCRQNGWEVCIPLTAGGTLIGFISLGHKR